MNKLLKWLHKVFIDGLSGMALGLFSTLIIGTIIQQVSSFIGGSIGDTIYVIGKLATIVTGAGIGCGVAYKFKESPLVVISASVAGMIGAYAGSISAGTILVNKSIVLGGPGEPLGAFLAAYIAIEAGHLISGKTGLDILLTPIISIASGACVGLFVGPPISQFMNTLGEIINWAAKEQPFIMGVVISVIMGMVLTLPISSAALGIALKLGGIAAGAATVGCCVNMVGFAVTSYRENKIGGLVAQGLGTSMLQVPNIVKKPVIWIPMILTSAILGPVSTMLFSMENNEIGSGMGSAGLVGQFQTYSVMTATEAPIIVIIKIIIIQFVLPAILCLGISELMRAKGWIKKGDLKLEL